MVFSGMGGQVEAMEPRQQAPFRGFIKRHAVLTFYVLVFTFLWVRGASVSSPAVPMPSPARS